jgi:hypothetical protein
MFKRLNNPVNTKLAILCLCIVGLNLLDVFATLRHIEHGADEINPIMDALLNRSVYAFFAFKFVWVFVGAILILYHPRPQRLTTFVWMLTLAFAVLGLYHGVLFYILT